MPTGCNLYLYSDILFNPQASAVMNACTARRRPDRGNRRALSAVSRPKASHRAAFAPSPAARGEGRRACSLEEPADFLSPLLFTVSKRRLMPCKNTSKPGKSSLSTGLRARSKSSPGAIPRNPSVPLNACIPNPASGFTKSSASARREI